MQLAFLLGRSATKSAELRALGFTVGVERCPQVCGGEGGVRDQLSGIKVPKSKR